MWNIEPTLTERAKYWCPSVWQREMWQNIYYTSSNIFTTRPFASKIFASPTLCVYPVPLHKMHNTQLFYHQSSHVYHSWVSDTDTVSVSALVSGAEELFQMEQVQCPVSTQCPRDTWHLGLVTWESVTVLQPRARIVGLIHCIIRLRQRR